MRIRDASPAVVNDAASESVIMLNAKWATSGGDTSNANAPITAFRGSAGTRSKSLNFSVVAVTSHRARPRYAKLVSARIVCKSSVAVVLFWTTVLKPRRING